jgi:hypothetical protein
VLRAVAREFKLFAAIESINQRIEFARFLPLTTGDNQDELETRLRQELGL